LPESSLPGMLLHTLVGYDSRPAGMQIVFYLAVLVAIFIGMRLVARPRQVAVTK
jgi:high-affinity iron transporter